MTNKTKAIELETRAHQGTIDYLESKKFKLNVQLMRNRSEIRSLADDQRTYKKGIFHLINLIRMQNGKEPFTWNSKKRKVIRKSRSKNKIFSSFPVIAYYKDDSHKLLKIFDTLELANKYTKGVNEYIEREEFGKKRPLAIKAHEARIILID